jgi:hypothetical protein
MDTHKHTPRLLLSLILKAMRLLKCLCLLQHEYLCLKGLGWFPFSLGLIGIFLFVENKFEE